MEVTSNLQRVIGLLLVIMVTGCVHTTAIKDAPNPLEIDVTEYERMFNATIAVLREEGFGVQVKDYRMGTIVSLPAISPSLFEFWRIENSVQGNRLQGTLNKQRRTITINILPAEGEPAGNAQTYDMAVQVVIEQEQNPQRQLTSSTSGYSVFASYSQNPSELTERGISGQYWYPIGTDPLLEKKLLRTIVRRSLTVDMPGVDNSSIQDIIDQTKAPQLDELDNQ